MYKNLYPEGYILKYQIVLFFLITNKCIQFKFPITSFYPLKLLLLYPIGDVHFPVFV